MAKERQGIVKGKAFLKDTTDKKLWRAMFVPVPKGYIT